MQMSGPLDADFIGLADNSGGEDVQYIQAFYL